MSQSVTTLGSSILIFMTILSFCSVCCQSECCFSCCWCLILVEITSITGFIMKHSPTRMHKSHRALWKQGCHTNPLNLNFLNYFRTLFLSHISVLCRKFGAKTFSFIIFESFTSDGMVTQHHVFMLRHAASWMIGIFFLTLHHRAENIFLFLPHRILSHLWCRLPLVLLADWRFWGRWLSPESRLPLFALTKRGSQTVSWHCFLFPR